MERDACLQAALNQSLNYFPALFGAIYLTIRSKENMEQTERNKQNNWPCTSQIKKSPNEQ